MGPRDLWDLCRLSVDLPLFSSAFRFLRLYPLHTEVILALSPHFLAHGWKEDRHEGHLVVLVECTRLNSMVSKLVASHDWGFCGVELEAPAGAAQMIRPNNGLLLQPVLGALEYGLRE